MTDKTLKMTFPDKTLRMSYSGRIIDQLGIQMYQSAVAAVAEIITNAWDADADKVEVILPKTLDESACIIIKDDGVGMSFTDCEKRYLNVGYCRRGNKSIEETLEKHRPVLGRKGIGKFAGFGIAEIINIRTISKETKELTEFELNLNDLRGEEYVSKDQIIQVLDYQENININRRGTVVTLKSLKLNRAPSESVFLRSMARRFLLHRSSNDFKVKINDKDLPKSEEEKDVEFVFPRDFENEEKYDGLQINQDWGIETLSDGNKIKWRFCFYKKPIDEEQLRGISIYSHGKLCQTPFFFNLTGGLGGQHGQEYITGVVEADYLDELAKDLISPERQRIDFEQEESAALLNWGQEKIKSLLKIWKNERAKERIKQLEQKILPFNARIEKLSPSEKRTVKKAITNLAKVPSLEEKEFIELGSAILTTWEEGRLKDLIDELAQNESMNEQDLLQLLVETQVLTALNIAEAVKTKIKAVQILKDFIDKRDNENIIRDHIAENSWLISSEWETFKRERGLKKIIEDIAKKVGFDQKIYKGRIDLALYSGDQLLILEFMAPGLKIDSDHLDRYEKYIDQINDYLTSNTGSQFHRISGYIVADKIEKEAGVQRKIARLAASNMYAMDWNTLLQKSIKQYEDYLKILVSRNPDDTRLKALLE